MSDARKAVTPSREMAGADLQDLARRLDAAFPPLSDDERRIALAVYRELTAGRPAGVNAIGRRAGATGRAVADALDRWPGVYRDEAGRVVGFWGLALEGMPHPIRLGERTLFGWCAWDTLFLGELLGGELLVESSCGTTGRPVRVVAGQEGVRDLDPAGAVISFVDPEQCDIERDRVISSFCHHILFFASADAWRAWSVESTQPTFVLTVEEGWRLGRITNRLRYGSELGADPVGR